MTVMASSLPVMALALMTRSSLVRSLSLRIRRHSYVPLPYYIYNMLLGRLTDRIKVRVTHREALALTLALAWPPCKPGFTLEQTLTLTLVLHPQSTCPQLLPPNMPRHVQDGGLW